MSALHVEALTPMIGSLVHDIDLADPATIARDAAALRALFLERQVLFFRDQRLSPDAQLRFAQIFGQVRPISSTFPVHGQNPHVEILQSRGVRTGTDVWHADLTWLPDPPAATCLFAVDVPAVGGDTMWANMAAAYDSLDPKFAEYVSGLSAVHDWEGPELMASLMAHDDGRQRYERMRAHYTPVTQPVIATHPQTGRRVVYVNTMFTTRILGVSRPESQALVQLLSGLATVPEWQVRFRWQKGSLAIWDNRSVQHYAVNDYHPAARLMHRITVHDAPAMMPDQLAA